MKMLVVLLSILAGSLMLILFRAHRTNQFSSNDLARLLDSFTSPSSYQMTKIQRGSWKSEGWGKGERRINIHYDMDLNRTMRKTQAHYNQNEDAYGNKADFEANKRLFEHINSLNLDVKESVILVGGTNEGQLSKTILSWAAC